MLHDIVGDAVNIDNVIIVPAFYDIDIQTSDEPQSEFPLAKYMTQHQICFHENYRVDCWCEDVVNDCNAMWVRARIPNVYRFSPPPVIGWRYKLLDVPFLAILFDRNKSFPSLHPFACVDEDLKAHLDFFGVTTLGDRQKIAKVFWTSLLQGDRELTTFIDWVLGDCYDDYDSVVMGSTASRN